MSKLGSLGSIDYYEDQSGTLWVDSGGRMLPVGPEEADAVRTLLQ